LKQYQEEVIEYIRYKNKILGDYLALRYMLNKENLQEDLNFLYYRNKDEFGYFLEMFYGSYETFLIHVREKVKKLKNMELEKANKRIKEHVKVEKMSIIETLLKTRNEAKWLVAVQLQGKEEFEIEIQESFLEINFPKPDKRFTLEEKTAILNHFLFACKKHLTSTMTRYYKIKVE